jgi:hypothetical protein
MAHPTHTPHSGTGLRKARSILRPGHDPSVRQEILKRAREAMQRAGFEFERFDELKRRSDTALREALAKSRAAADERVPAMRDAVARSTEYWLKANKVGDTLSPGPDVFALSTADQISVDPAFSFLSENIAPWANSAQVILDQPFVETGDFSFDAPVTFKFSFENQTGAGNLFTVNALLGVTGSCDATANGYWFDLVAPRSALIVTGSLGITVITDSGIGQVIIPPGQSDQIQVFVWLDVSGDWGGVGTIAGQDLFRTYILSYSDLYVPANARVEFDVSCDVYFSIDGGGSCEFLAAGNGRQVTAPGVFVTMQPWIIT